MRIIAWSRAECSFAIARTFASCSGVRLLTVLELGFVFIVSFLRFKVLDAITLGVCNKSRYRLRNAKFSASYRHQFQFESVQTLAHVIAGRQSFPVRLCGAV